MLSRRSEVFGLAVSPGADVCGLDGCCLMQVVAISLRRPSHWDGLDFLDNLFSKWSEVFDLQVSPWADICGLDGSGFITFVVSATGDVELWLFVPMEGEHVNGILSVIKNKRILFAMFTVHLLHATNINCQKRLSKSD